MNLLFNAFSLLLPCSGLLHAFGLGYYSPGALLLLLPLGALGIFKTVMDRTIPLWQVLLLFFVVLYMACGAYHLANSTIARNYLLSREAATILGVVSLIGISHLFRQVTVDEAARRLMLGVDLTLIVLTIEALAYYHLAPGTIKETLNTIFAGRSTIRLQGPTQEASFVSAYLATLFPYAVYHVTRAKTPRNILRVVAMVGFLFAIVSMQGLIVWIAGVAGGLLYFMFTQTRRVLLGGLAGLVVLLAGGAFGATLWFKKSITPEEEKSYVESRLEKIRRLENPADALFLDYSVFNRLSAPYYGLRAGTTQPLGVGPGGFGAYYRQQLAMVPDTRVQEFLNIRFLTDAEDTKSLVIQYIAEVGILSLLFIVALVLCWRQRFHQAANTAERTLAVALLACFCVMTINAGSMLNLPFWICLVPLRPSRPSYPGYPEPSVARTHSAATRSLA